MMKENQHNRSNKHSPPKVRGRLESTRSIWNRGGDWARLSLPSMPPIRILLLLVLSIFTAETCIMLLLPLWPSLPVLHKAMIDATILVLILSPTFYFFHYRPLIQNLRQREQIMAALSKSEERLHLALQAVNDGLWDWNIESGDVYYSPNCALMLGYQPEELEPDFGSLLFLIHPEDRDTFERLVNEHLSGRLDTIEIDLRLKCRIENRGWLWVQIRGKVVDRATDGTPLRAVGTNTNIHERKQTEQALFQSKEGVRYLSRQLINTSEVEKKHLAQELHDDFGQMISSFKMGVELIRSQQYDQHPELEFHCVRLLDIGERMEAGLREICDDLRPAMLDDLGLTKTLEWLINQFTEQHKNIRTGIEQPEISTRLPAEIELVCYRVCQEALHNVSKHAQPTVVDVKLSITEDDVLLTISDNGVGFDPTQHQNNSHWGIGLLGIYERAAAIGGSATIESTVGNGTCISLALPRDPEK